MAGNLQGDNSGNILVEFDYNNIIVVDPNKTIDALGNIRERLVDHENLVMYANLEAEVVPRTKLSVGGSPDDKVRTLSIAKMNFLRPTEKSNLTTGYYDELTGKNSRNGLGDNQMQKQIIDPKDGTQPYTKMTVADPGGKSTDNGLLGITSISVKTNSSFIPSVTMQLEDVQGRALFQLGDNSPYSAFFNLPYCPFYLTLKGYYGQAIRYQLNLTKFNARFNTFSGNYQIDLEFVGYKFNILNEISMGSLFATPHMYSKTFNVSKSPTSPEGAGNASIQTQLNMVDQASSKVSTISSDNITSEVITERGYQKITEVYSEYKAKGLISPDFPEWTMAQLMNNLLTFEQSIADRYTKADVEPLTNIRTYKETLGNYFNRIYGGKASWFNTYINPKPIILKGTNQEVYIFKQEFIDNLLKKGDATSQLSAITTNYNALLAENKTLGVNGKTPIKNSIKYDTFSKQITLTDIDLVKTTTAQTGILLPTETDTNAIQLLIEKQIKPTLEKDTSDTRFENLFGNLVIPPCFVFSDFQNLVSNMESQANQKLAEEETALTSELAKKIQEKIGFNPTVRNICAVIMASAEGFIRLLDEVHTKAWNVKYDPVRQLAILNNTSSAPGTDTVDKVPISEEAKSQNQGLVNGQIPVYPWPQFFVETPEDKKGRFQLKYIGDPSVVNLTKGYLYEKWPEVEFVEEYMKGLTQKFNVPVTQPSIDNQKTTNIINVNAIEYPSEGIAYVNKEEIKFFYEIWERQFLTSNYSGFIRANNNQIDQLTKLIVSAETNNIVTGLGVSSPFLSLKLKNYNITAQNYPSFLSNISNQGTGRAYQDYLRDFFVTPYIKNLTENSFNILSLNDLGKEPQASPKLDGLLQLVKNVSNDPLIVDTYPFTDPTWVSRHMANSITNVKSSVYNTNKVLTVFDDRDVISNFNDINNYTKNRPVTNFSYLKVSNPSNQITSIGLDGFYLIRKDPTFFVPTEGYVNYISPNKNIPVETTTSMLNTPYFINAIQNGVSNWRRKDPYPYTQAAYLFINSLPLASLKEKYKTDGESSDLDYIASCFKKFGAIHKMPYAWVLKMGSIWYRYKTYKTSNIDILDSAWTNFNYKVNFDPITSSDTKTYTFKFDGVNKIKLQDVNNNITKLQTGFYPKVINDFNVFYNGYDLYSGYTDTEMQRSIDEGVKVYNFADSNINAQTIAFPLITPVQYSSIQTWSVILPNNTFDPTNLGNACNPNDNTTAATYYVVPSFGTQFNQVTSECLINNTPVKSGFLNNPSIYNGSVRLLWSAPNYGYFDNTQMSKPQPDSYVNKIETGVKKQSAFKLLMDGDYSKIEEIFSVFDKKVLDKFEQEFLNFCKPVTNIDLGPQVAVPIGASNVDPNALFKNFQYLFRSMMEITGKNASTTTGEYFKTIGEQQLTLFSSTIKSFLEYDVILKYGNPAEYNRRVMASYMAQGNGNFPILDPINFNSYIKDSLPSKTNTITLALSKSRYPQAWLALETEVGFSTIENLIYDNNGSYITDFFIDNNIEFTANNVVLLAPIIKMYATQKLYTPTLSQSEFKSRLQTYLGLTSEFQNNILNQILTQVRAKLPNQQELPERAIQSVISGEQSKVENYEVFKALNDKWVAGSDYTTKTLFEDFMFLDRASRNIGDTIVVDIFDLKDNLSMNSLNMEMSVFVFISGMLIKNKFNVMPLPAYVNFYNIQDVDGTTIPQPEGKLEFADNMWGTFLDVDYRKSGPKMVCFYAGQPSTHLDLPKGNSRFRDDAFDLRRASDNPLIENPAGKKDYATSNKCVGFNVDIGVRNQNIFFSFNIAMDGGKATSETIQTQLNMVDQASGRNVATQNVSLYNLYKQRSYQCQVQSLGNALLQPTMYFNLRHVPMFNGPYFITEVNHTVTPGNFVTTFNGTRQGIYDLPTVDNYLQSINQNLLTKIEALVKNSKDGAPAKAITSIDESKLITQAGDSTAAAQNSCRNKLASEYQYWGDGQPATATRLTQENFVTALKNKIPNNPDLQVIIYMICYANTFNQNTFVGYNNNFANVPLTNNYYDNSGFFSTKKYSCVNIPGLTDKTPQPIANFDNIDRFFDFMINKLRKNVNRVFGENAIGITKYYVCYWPVSNVTEEYYNSHLSEFTKLNVTFDNAFKSAGPAGLNVASTTQAKVDDAKQKKKIADTYAGVTTQPNNLNTTTNVVPSCPPPTITSFSPLTGVSGTILTIVGNNLDEVTGATINNVLTTTGITIFSKTRIAVVVPRSNTVVAQSTPIILRGVHGNGASLGNFTYNPAQVTPTPSNPNNTNSQPQQTGPVTLDGITQSNPNGSTTSLTVGVNPQAAATNTWTLQQEVAMEISVYDNNVVNNVKTETLNRSVNTKTSSYVSSNTFTITYANVQSMLITNPIDEFKTTPVTSSQTVKIKFTVTAVPTDKVKNPQNVPQTFNFTFIPTPSTTPTFPEVALSITSEGVNTNITGNGPEYFNITKPDNSGYITFRFNAPGFQDQDYSDRYFIDSSGQRAAVDGRGGASTNYTYVYDIKGKGEFRLVVKYRPYGNKSPIGGQVLVQTVTGPPFTL